MEVDGLDGDSVDDFVSTRIRSFFYDLEHVDLNGWEMILYEVMLNYYIVLVKMILNLNTMRMMVSVNVNVWV